MQPQFCMRKYRLKYTSTLYIRNVKCDKYYGHTCTWMIVTLVNVTNLQKLSEDKFMFNKDNYIRMFVF